MQPIFKLSSGVSLYLASASPRRQSLLAILGAPFEIILPNISEPAPEPNELPQDYAARLASCKAQWANAYLNRQPAANTRVVITADTIVCLDRLILGKPRSLNEAIEMLRLLNGKQHTVCTAVHIACADDQDIAFQSTSKVVFGQWPDETLKAYARTGEGMDKAGAYGIQGQGSFLVKRVEGSYTSVIGLPLEELTQTLLAHEIINSQGKI